MAIAAARRRGVTVYAETCPQYIALDSTDLDRPGLEGAKALCSPPPRWPGSDAAIWQGLEDGFFNVFSSDHSPYRFDKSGKFPHGGDVPFNRISSGVPGIETRSPILFSEGVSTGRIDINRFVALNSPMRPRFTASIRARAPSRSGPMPISASGTTSMRRRSTMAVFITRSIIPPVRGWA
ncbi:hypothetical protein [Nordella sp. HKS 07]|uniref:hypothetical protein n=1 Tax=Nordella sp. HKS 07 TaxID=2712222 RepID=UPI001FEEE2DA|nr:hypothetical protein [Nordella sp. HKS 07]